MSKPPRSRPHSARPGARPRTSEPSRGSDAVKSGKPQHHRPARRKASAPAEQGGTPPQREKQLRHSRPRRNAPEAEAPAVGAPPQSAMRIAKAMARAGLCSRRDAERWIADGRVRVNGTILTTPACEIGPKDRVLVDGKPLPVVEPPRLWRYHKPRGLVTTHRDPDGRPTVFEKLPPELGRIISVGRLDVTSEGLLLLTNNGALARHLELPATGWLRRYRVRAHGRVTTEALERLKRGITVEGVAYGPIEATLDKEQGANVWLTVGLREGKNREVRKVLAALGLDVNRLIRISYGPFQLLDLAPGATDAVRRRVLAEQLGPAMARELGLTEAADADRDRRRTARDEARKSKEAQEHEALAPSGGDRGGQER